MTTPAPTPTPARCDLLIIGAGPAGMAAALAAAPSGMRIVVVDDNPAPGGQIWRDGPGVDLPPLARQHRDALARHANIEVLSGTRVVGLGDRGGTKGIGLNQISSGGQIAFVDAADDIGAGQRQQFVIAFDVFAMLGETRTSKIRLR